MYPAATSIDVRPTFTPDGPISHVEAHILDFNGDLYGHPIKLNVVEYLRPEEKFPSTKKLLEQIQRNIEKARNILG